MKRTQLWNRAFFLVVVGAEIGLKFSKLLYKTLEIYYIIAAFSRFKSRLPKIIINYINLGEITFLNMEVISHMQHPVYLFFFNNYITKNSWCLDSIDNVFFLLLFKTSDASPVQYTEYWHVVQCCMSLKAGHRQQTFS